MGNSHDHAGIATKCFSCSGLELESAVETTIPASKSESPAGESSSAMAKQAPVKSNHLSAFSASTCPSKANPLAKKEESPFAVHEATAPAEFRKREGAQVGDLVVELEYLASQYRICSSDLKGRGNASGHCIRRLWQSLGHVGQCTEQIGSPNFRCASDRILKRPRVFGEHAEVDDPLKVKPLGRGEWLDALLHEHVGCGQVDPRSVAPIFLKKTDTSSARSCTRRRIHILRLSSTCDIESSKIVVSCIV